MASIFSFFTGSGFLDLGFEKAGFKTATVNEFHPPFMDAYKHSRKTMGINQPIYGYYECSVEEFVGENKLAIELQEHIQALQHEDEMVGFIGGPPCPDFSVGGKNKGQEGDNGRLSLTYVNAIIQHQPDFFLFENVKGLWRTKRHREFYDSLKESLYKNGYALTDKLVNCIQYGAPQDRDRILLFGIKKDHLDKIQEDISDQSLEELFNWDSHILYSRESVFDAVKWPTTKPFSENSLLKAPTNIIEELTIEHWFKRNNVNEHPNAKAFFKPKSDKFKIVEEGDTSKKSFKRLHRWRYSPTAAYGNNEVHLHPYEARRLSASEALAIQSLPMEFELPDYMTLSDKFKTIGNGVPYLASLGVAKTIKDFLQKIS
ncbi:TPA: DNA cytosine methyltransferase [Vibrio parahaemolyticus]|uniref:DNA cytosine methyltransferase n=1 Tax=Vibrio parahaemolyticus TaxID=670 RepID=UPI0004188EC7|nr:DNA cytosine methyltransferase [Vibrio parahaemolyticus]KZW07641.1 modification methylase [Vibrio parahaemolyticus]KZW09621.1 modification methylase [Vibrio parahaemolyticus]KZW17738.1 modification methylase [Vibrio parahaemolyticus]KZW21846.1 modification methylase [Vibrio parahaemolyticus]KZW24552.1 modification methylase [Vibrio parahaemolyticus]